MFLFVTLSIQLYRVKKGIAILNCSLLNYSAWDNCSSWVALSITINICSCFLGVVLKAFWSENLVGSSIQYVKNLSRAFQYCYLFPISPLYNYSIGFDASVAVLVCPDSFYRIKTSHLVQIFMKFAGRRPFIPSPGNSSDSPSLPSAVNSKRGFWILSTPFLRFFSIHLFRFELEPFAGRNQFSLGFCWKL